jgi:hypothetical protein
MRMAPAPTSSTSPAGSRRTDHREFTATTLVVQGWIDDTPQQRQRVLYCAAPYYAARWAVGPRTVPTRQYLRGCHRDVPRRPRLRRSAPRASADGGCLATDVHPDGQ